MTTAKGNYLQVLSVKFNFSLTFIAEVFIMVQQGKKHLTSLERMGCEHVVQQGNCVGVGDLGKAELSKV